jgi:hypothetical protein
MEHARIQCPRILSQDDASHVLERRKRRRRARASDRMLESVCAQPPLIEGDAQKMKHSTGFSTGHITERTAAILE